MNKSRVCVVTGTRADYGLLYWLMKGIQTDKELELQIIVTGMHLSPEFGLTYKMIEEDGFIIDEKVEMLLSSDTAVGIAKSIGLGVIGFADTFERLKPDILVVLGDRYEILAAAQAAMVAKIPIAHIAGGDTTEGAFDEAIRHSLTKMSHLHFVTNEASLKRVRQLGENPKCIFNVGSPGIDFINKMKIMSKESLEDSLKIKLQKKNILVTFHPSTLDRLTPKEQIGEVLDAIDLIDENIGIIFTKPNADNGGHTIIEKIELFAKRKSNVNVFSSLGQIRYLSMLKYVDVVVGNSSSGLYEVPSFKKPTVNIGDRQKGRLQASSVIGCAVNKIAIVKAINKAFAMDCSNTVNPYGNGKSSEKMISVLKELKDYTDLLQKHFFEVK
ncbi:UDP-N-acetyl-D-glucosamine 2-epimerase, UDP-hydrolysing [Anaerobacillus alkalidiazotrophicus]|uniref:UDP-N-acetyl-D-glucosamine 2-epimerase, UDP-hydrolysing n=1 Tax=Anaerobacillus alkalidiazotrophicus TaxID=472963 RepID=A0A1S2MCS6_9BACI|nr:UDP-N-acetylglucosamine 2-epimerase [Anaerobacillus alkalidiazotrophicus]OIJ22374.1 UDP-N-acetyl-D-glucosamine 2-epimerase, UDP-hydrolysing [Anaerobacillus alkalidiazotrophicus]